MRNKLTFILFGLLISVGWTNALAQQQPTQNLAERLTLSVADYQSVYDPVAGTNTYTNILDFALGSGDNKITAGMLNAGDNFITFHRLDSKGGDVECARVNLNAVQNGPSEEVYELDFSTAPSSNTTVTNAALQELGGTCWGTDGSNLIWQTNGSAYITGIGGLTFTAPAGCSNSFFELIIFVGSNVRNGRFAYRQNSGSWYILNSNAVSAGGTIEQIFTMSTGDVISIVGLNSNNGFGDSPDIELMGFVKLPESYVPTYEVTPTISNWDEDNEAWGQASALPGTTATTYTDNDVINLTGQVTDEFDVEIPADNQHPDYYTYKADFDADITLPSSGTGANFSALADFTSCTSSNLTSGTFTGYNGWSFYSSYAYQDDNDDIWGYAEYYGGITFTMPNSFMGSTVNVTVTSGPCLDHNGSGDLYVNGVLHTFNGASTYTWTNVPVTAGGTIEIRGPQNTWSADIASIVITSGNGSSMNMPKQQGISDNSRIGEGSLLLKRYSDRSNGKVGKIEKKASVNAESKIMLKSND